MIELPVPLYQRLYKLCNDVSVTDLQKERAALTAQYHGHGEVRMHTRAQRLSYLATRMPSTYAALCAVLSFVPDLDQMTSLLDLGSGPGTVLWALKGKAPLQKATLVEQDSDLLSLSKDLWEEDAALSVTHQKENLLSYQSTEPADLVTISYVWGELDPTRRFEFLEKVYENTLQYLVLVEPGTPHHYQGLLEARAFLLEKGAQMVAPCPHAGMCPLKAPDWCHFSVAVKREALHRQVKEAHHPFELEKYSYLIVSKQNRDLPQGRLVRPPLKRSGHVILDVCDASGALIRKTVTKKDKHLYQAFKKKEWGDAL
ncbi:MAG: hypothetical protein H2057_05890 [Alphaproteobacteria bacterium]|nr:hypothetical protein [Alphaproteobacteria bacterium]